MCPWAWAALAASCLSFLWLGRGRFSKAAALVLCSQRPLCKDCQMPLALQQPLILHLLSISCLDQASTLQGFGYPKSLYIHYFNESHPTFGKGSRCDLSKVTQLVKRNHNPTEWKRSPSLSTSHDGTVGVVVGKGYSSGSMPWEERDGNIITLRRHRHRDLSEI